MNSAVRSIFNESFVEKRDLWVMWTVHGTHGKTTTATEMHFKKKKTKQNKKQNADTNTDVGKAVSKRVLSVRLALA